MSDMQEMVIYLVLVALVVGLAALAQISALRREISVLFKEIRRTQTKTFFAPSEFIHLGDAETISTPSFEDLSAGAIVKEATAGIIYTNAQGRPVDREVDVPARVHIREFNDNGECVHRTWGLLTDMGVQMEEPGSDRWVQHGIWLRRKPPIVLDDR